MSVAFTGAITAETTFGEIDRQLSKHHLKVISLTWQADDATYSVRVGYHNVRFKHIYYGTGRTLHSALTSALDDFVIYQANTYARPSATT